MKRALQIILFLGLTSTAFGQANQEGRVITVKMIDQGNAQWRFEPANISVRPGDTVRWIQEDVVPHNVEFKDVPDDADLGDATMGAFVFAKGDVYELLIDGRFAEGLYKYVCTPHAPLGMRAEMTVLGAGSEVTR
jgi:plastocyanin